MTPQTHMTDLVQRARLGDTGAFTSLYREHLEPIYRFVFYRVRSKEDAEDLTQTVFLKAWRSLPMMRDGSMAFSSWLYTIARNTVIDYWKKKKDVLVDDEDAFFSAIPDKRENQQDVAEKNDEVHRIVGAFNSLSEEQQEIVMLRFFKDLSTSEISHIMHKREPAVRALQYRALKRLRSILD